MTAHLLVFLSLLLVASFSQGLKVPIYRRADGGTVINKQNLRYTVNITISGTVVNVALDTGSTDLWVLPPGGLATFNDTGLTAELSYGDGSDTISGSIGVGEFQLGSYKVPRQAFLNAQEASLAEQADFDEAIFGLIGLSFDTPGASQVNDVITQTYGESATWGQSVLANIFAQNPSAGNFFGMSLSRLGDSADSADGSLTISEYDSNYEAVKNSPKLPQFPANSGAWTVQHQGLTVNGKKIPWTSAVDSTIEGQIVVLDTGTTNLLVPVEVRDAIYSLIPGAVFAPDSSIPVLEFSEDSDVWVVPCNASIDLEASFGGQTYPLHPLDITDIETVTSPDGLYNYTVCVGSIGDLGTIGEGAFDALFGDSFLRNVYSVFDFGESISANSSASIQLLSVTDKSSAATDYQTVRANLLASGPGELAPIDLVKIFNGTEPSKNPGKGSSGGSGQGSTGSGQGNSGSGQGNSGSGQGNSGGKLGNGGSRTAVTSSFIIAILFAAAAVLS